MNVLFMLLKRSKNLLTTINNMKINSIYIGIVILILASCTSIQKGPILNINRDIIDFGEIKSDSLLTLYFEYQNTGSDSLKIIKAVADCGCNDVKYDKEILNPGEKGIIEVIYQPKSNSDSGFVSKNIALMTNAATPIKIIKIKGVVIK